MKSIRIYLLFFIGILFVGCSEDTMDKINENVNDPKTSPSTFILTDVMTSTSFSTTGADYAFYSSVFMEYNVGIWGQMYNAETRVGEPISATTYNNSWDGQYANLYNLKQVINKCSEGGSEAGNFLNLGIAQILSAYQLAMLTDLMGDVPYKEALQPGVIYQPKLDKQEELYAEVFRLLDDAIANLGKTFTFASLGTQDLIYKGDKAKWIKAANGLKARYTLRLSLKNAKYDKVIEYANASFASAAEDFKYVYNGGSTVNPFSRFQRDRDYFGASKSLKAKLDAFADPRASKFFKPYTTGGALLFADNGEPEQVQKKYSISALTSTTSPTRLMSYHELQFVKAEAYVRMGAAQLANAGDALKKGVEAAFIKVGLTAAQADAYYTASVLPRFTADPLKEVMNQKYLALYDEEAIESYNDYRRLKAMGNENLITLANPNKTKFPLRFTYGTSDVTTNLNIKDAYGDGTYVYTENVWWAGGTR